METATGTATATEEAVMGLRTAVATATGTVRATASATEAPPVVRAALETVSGTAAATGLYLLCTMGLLPTVLTLLTRIITAMTILFLIVVMDFIIRIRLLAAVTVSMTTASIIVIRTAAKTIVMEAAMVAGSIMTAAFNLHAAAQAAALHYQLLVAAPAAQLLLSALPQAPAPGPVHLRRMLLCPIHGLQDHISTREEATLVPIFRSTLSTISMSFLTILKKHQRLHNPKTVDPTSTFQP